MATDRHAKFIASSRTADKLRQSFAYTRITTKTLGSKLREKRLVFSPSIDIGGGRDPIEGAPIVTVTSKMRCGSFSLPAGPNGPQFSGTCPGAWIDTGSDGFICHGCYARGGMYRFDGNKTRNYGKRKWVETAMRTGTFVPEMVEALGMWFGTVRRNAGKIIETSKYFRIHDSGDFWSADYFQAWCETCNAFKSVTFWAPTRVWPLGWGKEMPRLAPKNLILRPSALNYLDPAPAVAGFAAGSTSTLPGTRGHLTCPAYDSKEVTCEEAVGPDGTAPCRACWTDRRTKISYPPHGRSAESIVKRMTGKSVGKPHRNPPPSLDAAYEAYARDRKSGAAGEALGTDSDLIGAWMAAVGISVDDYSELEWQKFLRKHIPSASDRYDFLDNMAEWAW